MIMPDIKRVVRWEAFAGKTIKEVVQKAFAVRFIFTDGTFADLVAEATADAKIVVERSRPRRERPYH